MKKFGLLSMTLLCLNGIVGSGIFLLPGEVSALVGKWGLFVYFAVALLVMSIGWCFAKCASHFSQNGGPYLYAKEAFGSFIGYEVGIMRWVVMMISWASLTVGFVTALGALFPVLLLSPVKQSVSIAIIASLAIINLVGINIIKWLSNIVTTAKLFPLIAFIVVGFFAIDTTHLFTLEEMPFSHEDFGAASLIIFFAFCGFDALPMAASEMENPKKNIPRAILIAITLSSLLYIFIQTICMGTLGKNLPQSTLPIADVMASLFGSSGKLLVTIATLISIGGVTIASSFFTPRCGSSMAEGGLLPPILCKPNRFQTPFGAILFSASVSSLIILASPNFVELATLSVVARFAQYSATAASLYQFDRKGLFKPFDRPWKKLIPLAALSGIIWLGFQATPHQLLMGLGALFIAAPFYWLQKRKSSNIESEQDA